eukprot:TRINITY_DN1686_c1_g1_i2.p2 TRINITY_DN1686_c1_g1~~TRINITY_DN1686_c1_g1_i2.p2  ORF type:complete len:198 (-),score=-10.32 TRINITY_DN1686_c1_g1_i2:418-924(-)
MRLFIIRKILQKIRIFNIQVSNFKNKKNIINASDQSDLYNLSCQCMNINFQLIFSGARILVFVSSTNNKCQQLLLLLALSQIIILEKKQKHFQLQKFFHRFRQIKMLLKPQQIPKHKKKEVQQIYKIQFPLLRNQNKLKMLFSKYKKITYYQELLYNLNINRSSVSGT